MSDPLKNKNCYFVDEDKEMAYILKDHFEDSFSTSKRTKFHRKYSIYVLYV